MDLIGVAGGVAKSTHEGFGFTLAVNNLDRTTLALIGSNPLTSDGATPAAGDFNVASLDDEADETGVIVSVTYAAAASSQATSTTQLQTETVQDPIASLDSIRCVRSRTHRGWCYTSCRQDGSRCRGRRQRQCDPIHDRRGHQ